MGGAASLKLEGGRTISLKLGGPPVSPKLGEGRHCIPKHGGGVLYPHLGYSFHHHGGGGHVLDLSRGFSGLWNYVEGVSFKFSLRWWRSLFFKNLGFCHWVSQFVFLAEGVQNLVPKS